MGWRRSTTIATARSIAPSGWSTLGTTTFLTNATSTTTGRSLPRSLLRGDRKLVSPHTASRPRPSFLRPKPLHSTTHTICCVDLTGDRRERGGGAPRCIPPPGAVSLHARPCARRAGGGDPTRSCGASEGPHPRCTHLTHWRNLDKTRTIGEGWWLREARATEAGY